VAREEVKAADACKKDFSVGTVPEQRTGKRRARIKRPPGNTPKTARRRKSPVLMPNVPYDEARYLKRLATKNPSLVNVACAKQFYKIG
jgi:hypothetical protein